MANVITGNAEPDICKFRFVTRGGKRSLIVNRADAAKAHKLADQLRDAGFDLPPKPDEQLILSWLTRAKPKRFRQLVRAIGWQDKNSIFVTPNGVIGTPKLPISPAEPKAEHFAKFKSAGTLKGWQTEVAKPAGELSSRFIIAVCAAFAAPLVGIIGRLTQGIHLHAKAGTGKTTALVIAGSTYGVATEEDVPKASATEVAREELLMGHNGVLFLLDEFGLLQGNEKDRAEQVRRLAYVLASGRGKAKSSVYTKQNKVQQTEWDTLVLSSGEEALSDLLAMGGKKPTGGQESRFIDLPASRKGSLGVIDYVPNVTGSDLGKWAAEKNVTLREACQRNHGHAFPAFIEQVIANRKTVKARIKELMREFRRRAHIEYLGFAESRKADLFGLIYAAGLLAVEWKILPWTAGQVGKAIRRCYRDACETQPEPSDLVREGLQIIRDHIASGSLIDLRHKKPASAQEMGAADGLIRVSRQGAPELVVKADRFRSWFKSNPQIELVLNRFIDAKLLDGNKARHLNTRQCRMPKLKEKPSCYVFDLNGFQKLAP